MENKLKVVAPFRDKLDSEKEYSVGDFYEHENADRVAFLVERGFLEEKSKQPPHGEGKSEGEKDQKTDDPPDELKELGSGWYELPNGEKVQGKDKAMEALAAIEGGE
ncbi:hypothetical protein [Halalkalibacterium ligniniphilum]|uniref:hypothetical protein n=1 Tax=Halalkalibacterium ligniniphilum TaxID=1134413 RepID=UPI00034640C0|nr:hypothetical protein [Halalkalibacterium ligniniphilum]